MKVVVLSVVLLVAVVSMACLGYLATQEWRRSAAMISERQVDEVDALLTTALMRDMSGAHASILMSLGSEQIVLDPQQELSEIFSRAFARFPYPESFFAWKSDSERSISAVMFNRTDRPPVWYRNRSDEGLFPVTVVRDTSVADRLVDMARRRALLDQRSAVFDTSIEGVPYQVVARIFYNQGNREQIAAIVGFTVNLNWVKREYFPELVRQIEHIAGGLEASPLSLSIVDQNGGVVSQTRVTTHAGTYRERRFPFAFFDSSFLPLSALGNVSSERWTARVSMADDALIGAAEKGAQRTSLLLIIGAGLSLLSLVLALYSVRKNFELAAMKADFVAMVTHELKTPLAGISLVGETLSRGRYISSGAIMEYGVLLSRETTRLRRLVENVLSFSRLTNARKNYAMVTTDVRPLLLEALGRLQPLIQEKQMDIKCDIADQLPRVRCDSEEITRALENLIENAIKYSDVPANAAIRAFADSQNVKITIEDGGRGILPEDIPRVFERFFRGKNAGTGGSGLGLAIAHTVIKDHGGDISIASRIGMGTLVSVVLPALQEAR